MPPPCPPRPATLPRTPQPQFRQCTGHRFLTPTAAGHTFWLIRVSQNCERQGHSQRNGSQSGGCVNRSATRKTKSVNDEQLGRPMGYRRVITAKDETGKSVFIGDETLEPLTLSFLPGVEFYRFGGGDDAPYVGPGAEIPTYREFFAAPGGYRFMISTIPADQTVQAPQTMDKKAVLAEVEEKLPGLLHASERE